MRISDWSSDVCSSDLMTNEERVHFEEVHLASQEAVRLDDEIGWQRVNMAFHECLYEGARNPYLRQEILRMRMRTQAYRKHAFGALGRLSISHRSHALIVQAIVAKNSAAAARAAFKHMRTEERRVGKEG